MLALFYARESSKSSRLLYQDKIAAATQRVGDQAICSGVYLPIY